MDQQQLLHHPTKNLILAALPADEYDRLIPDLQPISLAQGQVLYHADEPIGQIYFLNSGMAALLSTTAEGETTEIAMVGNEGMLGMPIVWCCETIPYQVIVQIAGAAVAMKVARLKHEFNRYGRLHDLLLRHTYNLVKQISQSAICNRFHTVEQRLCRWLLLTQDHTKSPHYNLTQIFLSYMLGAGRQRVNVAVGSLQEKGLIRYARGQIAILDRRGLEATSCECYKLIRPGYEKTVYLGKNFFS
jgi:CRP-like cAMP-binding protein